MGALPSPGSLHRMLQLREPFSGCLPPPFPHWIAHLFVGVGPAATLYARSGILGGVLGRRAALPLEVPLWPFPGWGAASERPPKHPLLNSGLPRSALSARLPGGRLPRPALCPGTLQRLL